MYLDSTAKSLEAFMGEAVTTTNPVYYVSYNDHTTSLLTPGDTQGSLNGVTDVTILAAPTASTQRQVTCLSIYNGDTVTHTVSIQKDVSATEYLIIKVTLAVGESLQWTRESGWRVMDVAGRYREVASSAAGLNGRLSFFFKPGTAPDTVGYWYSLSKDAGFPGAWAPGTPGLAGRTTDGVAAGDEGCLLIANPSSGVNFLANFIASGTLAALVMLYDVLWVNSGIAVTTTTGQTINSVAFPARDINGSTNGEGLMIGLLFVAAATNAAVINGATVTYTNSDGTASRTATLVNLVGAQIPVSPTIGTIVWFRLAAGDKGVRSIQTVTLGTSLVTGTVSLLVARPLAVVPAGVPNAGAQLTPPNSNPGVRLYNSTCALVCIQASSTTANTVSGAAVVVER